MTVVLSAQRQRPTTARPGAAEADIASGGAALCPVQPDTSAAAAERVQVGVRRPALKRLDGYGPTSHISEAELLRGYGLVLAGRAEQGR